jgi:hypothetical protein
MIGRLGPTFRRRVWDRPEIRYPLAGWLLFMVSAGFFIAASLRSGDPLGLAGAVFFLLACFFFLPPLFAEMVGRKAEADGHERDEEIPKWTSPRGNSQAPGGPGRRGSRAPKAAPRRKEFQADDSGEGKSP